MPENEFIVKDEHADITSVTLDDKEYPLDKDGNALDSEGKVFKTKEEVAEINKPKPEEFGEVIIKDATFKLDKEGNALDDKGVVLHTKDELIELEKTAKREETKDVIEIDKVEFILDEKGNALDDKGEIVHTKEAIDKMEEDSKEEAKSKYDIPSLVEATNISILDEEGKAVEYEDSEEGRTKYIQDVYSKGGEDSAYNVINSLYDTYPIVRRLVKHLELNNGSPEGFDQQVDYKSVDLDKDNTKQLDAINIQYFRWKGHSQVEAERFAQYSTDDKKQFEDAELHLKEMTDFQESRDQEEADLVNRQTQDNNERIAKERGFIVEKNDIVDLKQKDSIYDKIVNQGEIKLNGTTMKIPDVLRIPTDKGKFKTVKKAELINYVFIPRVHMVDGQKVMATGYEVYLHEQDKIRTNDNDILDMINAITGNDVTQLIEQKAKSDEVKKVRRLKSSTFKKGERQKVVDKGEGDKIKVPFK